MRKTVVRIGVFIVLLLIILATANKIFAFKYSDGISNYTAFYKQQDNTVDVLILGSSHAYVNFNHGTLYEDYGIASFTLGGSIQPMWNSYFDLKEALKTQTPELIVLEGYGTSYDIEYSDDSRIIKNTYGMKWSTNKIEAIKVSSEKERIWEFMIDYAQYHTRYSSLEKADFIDDFGNISGNHNGYGNNWKGQYLFKVSNQLEIADVSTVDYENALLPKAEEYYRKTIELALDNDIPIIVVVVPYALTESQQSRYNTAEKIAQEYGVEFLNCNLLIEETGLNLESDYADSAHMNAIGSRTFSQYIGNYLKEHFEITDRRGDTKYESWQEYANFVNQYIEDIELNRATSFGEIITEYISNPNYWVLVSADGSCNTSDDNIKVFFDIYGIDTGDAFNGVWLIKDGNLVWTANLNDSELYIRTKYRDFCLRHSYETNTNEIIIDNEQYKKVENGLNLVIFDTQTNVIADVIGIDKDSEYDIVR